MFHILHAGMTRFASRPAYLAVALMFALSTPVIGQAPTPEQEATLRAEHQDLVERYAALVKSHSEEERLPDVAVCLKAVEWALRHQEFYKPDYVAAAENVLKIGRERAELLARNEAPWRAFIGGAVLGYVSRVDQSVQPFAVTLPPGFDPNSNTRWPVHLVLHGRGSTLNEVSFFRQHNGKTPKDHAQQTWIQLDVFGRTNNAYRWAGETDVFEALAALRRAYPIDENRITLWGFSMGGAGAWHLGLHHPSLWSSVGAGAGFVDTVKYQKLKEPLPPLHAKMVRIYDAVDYAENAANVPVIGYGGELDAQLLAAKTMHERGEQLGVSIPLLVGPGVEHKWHPDSFQEFLAFHQKHTQTGRPRYPAPDRIRFVSYTLKYPVCDWLTIEEQIEPYVAMRVEASVDRKTDLLTVKTENIATLQISRDIAETISLDGGEPLDLRNAADNLLPGVYFEKVEGIWRGMDYRASREFTEKPRLHKRHNLQGPIDDAFMEPFLCVEPSGRPWHAAHAEWANHKKERFGQDFDKWLRGQVPTVRDTRLTDDQLADHNLILFGDPASNSVLQRVLPQLPIVWEQNRLEVAGQSYDPQTHAVVMIYPNPLNPRKYVVLNTGHTFGEKDFKASNAMLYPRLGDIAVLSFERKADGQFTETPVYTEVFNNRWQLPAE